MKTMFKWCVEERLEAVENVLVYLSNELEHYETVLANV